MHPIDIVLRVQMSFPRTIGIHHLYEILVVAEDYLSAIWRPCWIFSVLVGLLERTELFKFSTTLEKQDHLPTYKRLSIMDNFFIITEES
jgi:hypothetical protein